MPSPSTRPSKRAHSPRALGACLPSPRHPRPPHLNHPTLKRAWDILDRAPSVAGHRVLARLGPLPRPSARTGGFLSAPAILTRNPGASPRGLGEYARQDGAAGAGQPTLKRAWDILDRAPSVAGHRVLARLGPLSRPSARTRGFISSAVVRPTGWSCGRWSTHPEKGLGYLGQVPMRGRPPRPRSSRAAIAALGSNPSDLWGNALTQKGPG